MYITNVCNAFKWNMECMNVYFIRPKNLGNLIFFLSLIHFISFDGFLLNKIIPLGNVRVIPFSPFFFLIKNYKIRKLCLWIITDSSIKKNMILHNKTSVEYWTEFSDAEFHIRENRFNNSAAMYARGKQRSGTIVLSISLKLPVYSVQ